MLSVAKIVGYKNSHLVQVVKFFVAKLCKAFVRGGKCRQLSCELAKRVPDLPTVEDFCPELPRGRSDSRHGRVGPNEDEDMRKYLLGGMLAHKERRDIWESRRNNGPFPTASHLRRLWRGCGRVRGRQRGLNGWSFLSTTAARQ